MIDSSSQPLEVAARLLKPETVEAVRRSSAFHRRGWAILDRWALNCPRELKDLERQGEVILLGRLLQQRQMEHQVLSAALNGPLKGLADHEILAASEIPQDLS